VTLTRMITIAGFALCALLGTIAEWRSTARGRRIEPLGELLDDAWPDRAFRVTVLLFWWWIGWHFLIVLPEDG